MHEARFTTVTTFLVIRTEKAMLPDAHLYDRRGCEKLAGLPFAPVAVEVLVSHAFAMRPRYSYSQNAILDGRYPIITSTA
jgi:hypothetical protein